MLQTITSDFKAAGHKVTVLLDERISKLNPPIIADSIIPVSCYEDTKELLVDLAKSNDAVYIIAPETGKTLQSFVEIEEQTGKVSLNSESKTIEKVADKKALFKVLEKSACPIPKTFVLNVNDNLARIKSLIKSKLKYPMVFKPLDGTSCSGLSIVKEETQVGKAILKIKSESAEPNFIVQKFVEGETASISMLCAKGKAVAISLNKQSVKIGGPDDLSSYEGGAVPFDHPLKLKAFKQAEIMCEIFPGLRGYVGVDIILTKDKLFVVDVNPRLTTSYVALSRVCRINLAEALVNSILKGSIPTLIENNGYVCFSKYEVSQPTNIDFRRIAELSEVVSPPFPLNSNSKACTLVAGYGDSLENASLHLEEAKKRVFNIISRGK